ncbi:MAG: ammonium transporter [Brevinematia bacterium]
MLIPSNLPMVVIGTGLLWFGWFGFNAGSVVASDSLASAAFLNTNTASAVAALSWMFTEWVYTKKPTVLGLASGAVAGLVAITPAAGFVNVVGALIIGLIAGIIPYFMVAIVKRRLGYDDALDVFGIHGIAGILGAILTDVFADPSVNELGRGLIYENPIQLIIQPFAVSVVIIYDAIVTLLILLIIKIFVGLRVKHDDEITGLDESQHGESTYNVT